jgi:hypothetical protein
MRTLGRTRDGSPRGPTAVAIEDSGAEALRVGHRGRDRRMSADRHLGPRTEVADGCVALTIVGKGAWRLVRWEGDGRFGVGRFDHPEMYSNFKSSTTIRLACLMRV